MYRSPSAPMEKEKKIGEIDVTSLSPIFFEGRGYLSLGEHVLYLILFPTVKSALLLLFNIFTSCCWLDPLFIGSGSPFFVRREERRPEIRQRFAGSGRLYTPGMLFSLDFSFNKCLQFFHQRKMILLLSNLWHCFSFATGHYISFFALQM